MKIYRAGPQLVFTFENLFSSTGWAVSQSVRYIFFRLQPSYLSATSHTGRKSCRAKSLYMKRFWFTPSPFPSAISLTSLLAILVSPWEIHSLPLLASIVGGGGGGGGWGGWIKLQRQLKSWSSLLIFLFLFFPCVFKAQEFLKVHKIELRIFLSSILNVVLFQC
jgi:hypothetical protein